MIERPRIRPSSREIEAIKSFHFSEIPFRVKLTSAAVIRVVFLYIGHLSDQPAPGPFRAILENESYERRARNSSATHYEERMRRRCAQRAPRAKAIRA